MKTYLLIFTVLVLPLQIFGQSINSGIWTSNDFHFDFNPDTNLSRPQNNNVNSVENYDLVSTVFVYPNPSNGHIKFEYPNSTANIKSIKVFNSNGQLKKFHFVNGNINQIDLSFLPDGLYLLYFETSFGDRVIKKITLKKN